jgi:DNA-binding winged helix-turn-helix (wHTH) protein
MPILAFGPFRLDPRTLELCRDGRRIRIRPQPCRVLVELASRPGELVTREELRAAVWPSGVFVHFDLGLNSCLKQIRAALGESADSPRFVETLSGRGYRFIGEVAAEFSVNQPARGTAVRLSDDGL